MSTLKNLLNNALTTSSNQGPRISDVMSRDEVLADINARPETGADETAKATWIADNVINTSLAQWGKQRAKSSVVKLVIPAKSGNGTMITLEDGAEVWTNKPVRAGEVCNYFVMKEGMYYKNWDSVTETMNGFRKVLQNRIVLVNTQQIDEIAFEVAVRRELGAGATMEQVSTSNSLF